MTTRSVAEIKVLIVSCLERSITSLGFDPGVIADDFDMRAEGLVDSLGFVQLITDLEDRLGFEIDLADLDPGDLTTLGPLSRHIAGMYAPIRRVAGE